MSPQLTPYCRSTTSTLNDPALTRVFAFWPAAAGTASDSAADKNIRAEATYHLATLAHEAGRTDDVRQLLDEVGKIGATGIWAQRAMQLRVSLMGAPGNAEIGDGLRLKTK